MPAADWGVPVKRGSTVICVWQLIMSEISLFERTYSCRDVLLSCYYVKECNTMNNTHTYTILKKLLKHTWTLCSRVLSEQVFGTQV